MGKKARERLQVEFKDDGTFWMSWEDFQTQLNKIYVCRIYDTQLYGSREARAPVGPPAAGEWCRYEIEHSWTDANAGGCFNFPQWRKNPQFEIRTGEMTDAVFLLMQPDPRLTGGLPPKNVDASGEKVGGDDGGPTYDKKIGMYVMKGHEIYTRKVRETCGGRRGGRCRRRPIWHHLPHMAGAVRLGGDGGAGGGRLDSLHGVPRGDLQHDGRGGGHAARGVLTLRPLPLHLLAGAALRLPDHRTPAQCLICSTHSARWTLRGKGPLPNRRAHPEGNVTTFLIWQVLTQKPLERPPVLLPPLNELHVQGSWTEVNAGGCRNHVTWRNNEQYHLEVTQGARVSCVLLRHNPDAIISDTALHSKKAKAHGKKKKKAKDAENVLIGFVVAEVKGHPERKQLVLDPDSVVDKTAYVPNYEVAAEFYTPNANVYVVVPSTFDPGQLSDFELVVYTDDERASLTRVEPSSWHTLHAAGDWTKATAGGCRNHPTWVRNPLYQVRASRSAICELFVRQPLRQPELGQHEPEYPGIGFYLVEDDGTLSLEDVRCESGFRQAQETHASFELKGDVDYLLIPMTYKRGIQMSFEVDLYASQPSVRLTRLTDGQANARRLEAVEQEAALTIQHALARKKVPFHHVAAFLSRNRQLR